MGLKKTIFNFDVFNRWLTLFTNLGVIVGILLVVYEVRQNTLALDNGTDIAIWSIGSQTAGLVVESSEVAELLARFESEPWENFSKGEQTRLNVLLKLLIDRLELQLRLYERRGEILDRDNIVFPEYLLKLDTFKSWWEYQKHDGSLPDYFKKYFEAYIKEVNESK